MTAEHDKPKVWWLLRLLLAVVVCCVTGLAVGILAWRVITGLIHVHDKAIASAVGSGVWILTSATLLAYSSLYFGKLSELEKERLSLLELRVALPYALIGGVSAAQTEASMAIIIATSIGCGIVGAFVGFDVRRRATRISERNSR